MEELQCLATWKEGSSRYLVGKVHHSHATTNEDRFRCFVYEKTNPSGSGPSGGIGHARDRERNLLQQGLLQGHTDSDVDYRVAQSGDATCNGLFSATEGSRTMTLRRGMIFKSDFFRVIKTCLFVMFVVGKFFFFIGIRYRGCRSLVVFLHNFMHPPLSNIPPSVDILLTRGFSLTETD